VSRQPAKVLQESVGDDERECNNQHQPKPERRSVATQTKRPQVKANDTRGEVFQRGFR
jgi:hypothetical protein